MGVKAKKKARASLKGDAMEFALLIYDMYKAEKATGKIMSGQNYANDSKTN